MPGRLGHTLRESLLAPSAAPSAARWRDQLVGLGCCPNEVKEGDPSRGGMVRSRRSSISRAPDGSVSRETVRR
ncbi:hypothetical protein RRF57_002045 [Xylaria bambusicola]|uniref:Uncharacterized protein n=1 Tax=Xylaria bambusicola TaxID=326684 RepID=A0AAN7YVC0_9PEZI